MKLVILAQLHLRGSIYSRQIVAVGPSLPFARVCFWGPRYGSEVLLKNVWRRKKKNARPAAEAGGSWQQCEGCERREIKKRAPIISSGLNALLR